MLFLDAGPNSSAGPPAVKKAGCLCHGVKHVPWLKEDSKRRSGFDDLGRQAERLCGAAI